MMIYLGVLLPLGGIAMIIAGILCLMSVVNNTTEINKALWDGYGRINEAWSDELDKNRKLKEAAGKADE